MMSHIDDGNSRQVTKPLVSIILLVYNGEKYIRDCALSVENQSYSEMEIIVVDNGSIDGSLQSLKTNFPNWIYIQHGENLGFAAGMNSGFEVARGDYVVPLNQDVYLAENFIENSVNIMEELTGSGALGGIEYVWKNGELTSELRSPGPALFLNLRIRGVFLKINTRLAKSFGVNGSFPFLRRNALTELQRLDGHIYDPAYFSGWEDQDLWWRMQLRNWDCYATQETKAWHVGSSFDNELQSFIAKSTNYQSWIMRNRWFLILKNIPAPILFLIGPFLFILEMGLPFYLLFRSPRSLKAWFISWREIFGSIPSIIEKRSIIQQSRNLGLLQILKWFKGM